MPEDEHFAKDFDKSSDSDEESDDKEMLVPVPKATQPKAPPTLNGEQQRFKLHLDEHFAKDFDKSSDSDEDSDDKEMLAPVPKATPPKALPILNGEQQRFKLHLEADIDGALAVYNATSEESTDEARTHAWKHHMIRVCAGGPGTGKTTVVKMCIHYALSKGGRVLLALPTAQLANRMKELYGKTVDIGTYHAAFGFGEDIPSVACALALYVLVVIDEMSQLSEKQFEHIVKVWRSADKVPAVAFIGDWC